MDTELPVSAPRSGGGQWVGAIDLVLELSNYQLILIEHKSAPISRDACKNKATEYVRQLAAYDEILQAAGETVSQTWVHFPLADVLVDCGNQVD